MRLEKPLLLCVGVGSLLLAGWLSYGAVRSLTPVSPENATSGLVPEKSQIDLGTVVQGVHRAETTVVNRSAVPIRVLRVASTCRCADVDVVPEEIAPGERASVCCHWNTTGVRGVRGSEFTLLYVEGDALEVKPCPLSVRGEILPFFDIEPPVLKFEKGVTGTRSFRLVSRDPAVPVTVQTVKKYEWLDTKECP